MGERLVIVVEYDANTSIENPLGVAMEQLRKYLHHPDQPNIKVVQVHAAIRDDAQRVLDVFDKYE